MYPALHRQAVATLLAMGDRECVWQLVHTLTAVAAVVVENFPAKQSVHAPEPGAGLYFPARHATQVVVPVYPALHRQAEKMLLPVGEFEFV